MIVAQALSTIARHLSDPDLSVKRIVDELGHSRTILYEGFHEHVDMYVSTSYEVELWRTGRASPTLRPTLSRLHLVVRLHFGHSLSGGLSATRA